MTASKVTSSTLYGEFSQNTSRKYCRLTCDSYKINIYTSKLTTAASHPDKWRNWTA